MLPVSDPFPHMLSVSPVLLIDIFEHMIDCLACRTLLACALTCRDWYPRSLANLLYSVVLRSRIHLNGFKNLIAAKPFFYVCVKELHTCVNTDLIVSSLDHSSTRQRAGSHLMAFSAMLARRLTMSEQLHIGCVPWKTGKSIRATSYKLLAKPFGATLPLVVHINRKLPIKHIHLVVTLLPLGTR